MSVSESQRSAGIAEDTQLCVTSPDPLPARLPLRGGPHDLPPFPLYHYKSYQSAMVESWVQPGWRVLEIGCSAGYFTRRLIDRGLKVLGMDLNCPLVAQASRTCPEASFCAADAVRLPFLTASFDAVVMLEVIEHVGDNEALVLTEIYRILRPGGILFLSTPNAGAFAFLDPLNVKLFFLRSYPGLVRWISRLRRYRSPQLTSNVQVHKHYSLAQIEEWLCGRFTIRHLHRGGLLVYPLFGSLHSVISRVAPWAFLRRACAAASYIDSLVNYGRYSYNLILAAEKRDPNRSLDSARIQVSGIGRRLERRYFSLC